jgi:pimeloyl-ACP methyl ester carboxylesterase
MILTQILGAFYQQVFGPPPAPPAQPDVEAGGGLVVIADGIGGLDLCANSLLRVAPEVGLPHSISVHRWGHGLARWHADLTDIPHHRRMADELVDQVTSFRTRHPGVPVYLIGKSGGTGIVTWALERLPEKSVERAILLAPALSPGYDLSTSLRAINRDLVVFHSPFDLVLLGAGTCLFKTIDRVRGVGAGLVGFRPPPNSNQETLEIYRSKLKQVRWHPSMVRVGSLGGHLGVDTPSFLRAYVVPLLTRGGDGIAASSVRSSSLTASIRNVLTGVQPTE